MGGVRKDRLRHGIAFDRHLIHQAGERGDARPGIIGGIETMEEFVGVGASGFFEKTVVEGSAMTPAFVLAQDGS